MDSKETRYYMFESVRIKFMEIRKEMKLIQQENNRKNWYQRFNRTGGKRNGKREC